MSDTLAVESIERPLAPAPIQKLGGYEFYKQVLKSPKCVVAPMVDASELAWRILSRLHGADLIYTPMINANIFNSEHPIYQHEQFDLVSGEEGHTTLDRPLIAQFCSNDKEQFFSSAMYLAEKGVCDAVDLNLGCPQGIAKRGHYGSFLMEDWGLIESLIHHLHVNLPVPITAKFRVYDDVEKTVAYAKMLEKAGAQIITVHGRTRDQKGQLTGRADWEKIKAVREAVTSIPVFANGNILIASDVNDCISKTACDGVMSAEGNLYNPALFAPLDTQQKGAHYLEQLPTELREAILAIPPPPTSSKHNSAYPNIFWTSKRYLAVVKTIKTATTLSAVKSHLFKLMKPVFERGGMQDYRSKLASISKGTFLERIAAFEVLLDEIQQALEAHSGEDLEQQHELFETPTASTSLLSSSFPVDVCQPGLRPESDASKSAVPVDGMEADKKRTRSTSPEPTTKKAKLESKPCVTSGCQNHGAIKCPKGACKNCCPALGDPCEAHQGKMQKLADKRAAKKQHKQNRKELKTPQAIKT